MDKKINNSGWYKLLYINLPKIYFILQILVGIGSAFWVLINHQPKTGDDVEHLHSAWLVYKNEIPYVDFFQHHNPLLWYLFAPLVGYFSHDIIIFDIVRIISTCVMFLTLFYAAKIAADFCSNSKYAYLLTIASVFPSYVVFSGEDFRPDNYMVCSVIIGLYYLFAYIQRQKVKYLIISFACFFLSFMFMQKSVFFLSVIGIYIIYLLYTKKIKMSDFGKAMVFPCIGTVLFLSWLISHNMLEKYWLCNFIFNLYIPDVYNSMVEKTKPEFYVLSTLALVSFGFFMYYGNIYARFLCILWISEAIQRYFYFSLDRHYYYFWDILNAMMVGSLFAVCIKRWVWVSYIAVVLSFMAMIPFREYCLKNELSPDYFRYVTPKYVIDNTNRCDSVLNGYGLTYGIFTKDNTYYWNLNGQLDVIGSQIGLAPLPDLNAVVERYLPKIIFTGPFWNEKMRKRDKLTVVHQISPYIRDKYYNQSLFVDVFILKDEYSQKRRCRYNPKNDEWEYYYKE